MQFKLRCGRGRGEEFTSLLHEDHNTHKTMTLMLKMGFNSCYMLGFLTQNQAQQLDPPGEPVLSVRWQCGMEQGGPAAGPCQRPGGPGFSFSFRSLHWSLCSHERRVLGCSQAADSLIGSTQISGMLCY